jgi:hypothetical protein
MKNNAKARRREGKQRKEFGFAFLRVFAVIFKDNVALGIS